MTSTQSVSLTLASIEDTQRLAHKLAALSLNGSVWLTGDLGAGKTTLTRYWLRALGHSGSVKSPTYTLVEPYRIVDTRGQTRAVYHADLYRLQDPEELTMIGFDEYFDESKVLVIIEWASRAADYLPAPELHIEITHVREGGAECRQVSVQLTEAGIAQGVNIASLSH